MRQMPRNHSYFDPRFRMPQYGQVPRPRRWRFRWGIVWVVLVLLACVWLLNGVDVAFDWEDLLHWLNVRNTERYTRLCVLGISATCAVAIYRVVRNARMRNRQ